MPHGEETIDRRAFMKRSAAVAVGGTLGSVTGCRLQDKRSGTSPGMEVSVRTVLGPISPAKLGVTLMHEHVPLVDWSELYVVPAASIPPEDRAQMMPPSRAPSAAPVAVTTPTPPAIPSPPLAMAPPPSTARPLLVAAAPLRP